jgi:WD40-like Beta Propeller Repeat
MSRSETAALEGVRLDPLEAVSVALELAAGIHSGEIPGVPADARAIGLASTGRLVVDAKRVEGTRPAELATLLHSLLTAGGERPVPGALMLAIARAKGVIDLSGFATLEDFAATLRRFAPADTRQVLAALYERLARSSPILRSQSQFDVALPKLAPAPKPAEVHLTEAPAAPTEAIPPVVVASARRSGAGRVTAVAALIIILAGAGWLIKSGYQPTLTLPNVPPARVENEAGATAPVASGDTAPDAPTTLTAAIEHAYSPSFAPAGEILYFHTGDTEPSALEGTSDDRDTELLRVVDEGASNYHVRPSPDGDWIAFDSDRDGTRGVYIGHADGSEVRRVSGPGLAAVPSWSPDGRALAFVRAEPDRPRTWNVWRLDLATRELRRVTEFSSGQPWGASWFPDSRRIAYSHEDRLIVHDLSTGGTQVFQSPRPGRLVRTPAVSPDGTRIIYQVYEDGVWILDLEDGSARRLIEDPTAEELAWDPEGRRVSFHSRRGWSIFIMGSGT